MQLNVAQGDLLIPFTGLHPLIPLTFFWIGASSADRENASWGYHHRMSSPSNSSPAIQLPLGGQLLGFANPHPPSSECSAITNLQTQVAPLIVAMSCQLKVLKLLKPLVAVIDGLPNPPAAALEEFSRAAVDLAPCLLVPTSAGVLPFVRDFLCVEIKSLNCLLRNLESVLAQSGANPSSSSESLARRVLDSYPPIVGTLNLAAELFQMAGLTLPTAPVLRNGSDPASIEADQNAITAFAAALQAIADALGGCP